MYLFVFRIQLSGLGSLHHVDPRNWTQVFRRGEYSYPVIYLVDLAWSFWRKTLIAIVTEPFYILPVIRRCQFSYISSRTSLPELYPQFLDLEDSTFVGSIIKSWICLPSSGREKAVELGQGVVELLFIPWASMNSTNCLYFPHGNCAGGLMA